MSQQIRTVPRPPSAARCLLPAACCLLLASCGHGPASAPSDSTARAPLEAESAPSEASPAEGPSERAVEFALAMERGRNLEREGKSSEAASLYRELTARYPDRYQPYHRLGILADAQQHFDEAQQLYARAIQLRPDDPDLFNDLGYSLFLQGKLDQAERELLKAVALAPTLARGHNNLGLVYGHLGRYEEALEQFLQAGGSKADAHYNLGYVLASVEDLGRAKTCIERALAIDPHHQRARRALEEFRQLEQAQQEARPRPGVADRRASAGTAGQDRRPR